MQQALYEVRLRNAGILKAVEVENEHQLVKWGVQDHPLWRWFLILSEEVGEAVDEYISSVGGWHDIPHEARIVLQHLIIAGNSARYLLEGGLPDRVNAVQHAPDLGKEIIQIAAVAVAMEENRRRNDLSARGAA